MSLADFLRLIGINPLTVGIAGFPIDELDLFKHERLPTESALGDSGFNFDTRASLGDNCLFIFGTEPEVSFGDNGLFVFTSVQLKIDKIYYG